MLLAAFEATGKHTATVNGPTHQRPTSSSIGSIISQHCRSGKANTAAGPVHCLKLAVGRRPAAAAAGFPGPGGRRAEAGHCLRLRLRRVEARRRTYSGAVGTGRKMRMRRRPRRTGKERTGQRGAVATAAKPPPAKQPLTRCRRCPVARCSSLLFDAVVRSPSAYLSVRRVALPSIPFRLNANFSTTERMQCNQPPASLLPVRPQTPQAAPTPRERKKERKRHADGLPVYA